MKPVGYWKFETNSFISRLKADDDDAWEEFILYYESEFVIYIDSDISDYPILVPVKPWIREKIISLIWKTARSTVELLQTPVKSLQTPVDAWIRNICHHTTSNMIQIYCDIDAPEFIGLLQDDDDSAWEILIKARKQMLVGSAINTLVKWGKADHYEQAEDLFHDALIIAHNKIYQLEYNGENALSKWLVTIQKNVTRNFCRRLRYRDHLSLQERYGDDYEYLITSSVDIDEKQQEIIELYHGYIADILDNVATWFKRSMPIEDLRAVIIYRFLDFESPQAIAKSVGVEINTVYSVSRRVKLLLKNAFADFMIEENSDDLKQDEAHTDINNPKLNNTGE